MTLSKSQKIAAFALLALLMLATRFHHFLPIADASWAVFFAGGFYLASVSRWAFPALMLEAALIDYVTTQHMGVSDYCITVAYGFLVPAYAALWFGGYWLHSRQRLDLRGLALLVASLFVSVSIAYAISDGSFYWLGGRVASPNLAGYVEHFPQYYGYFLGVTCVYVSIVAVLHVLVMLARRNAVNHLAR